MSVGCAVRPHRDRARQPFIQLLGVLCDLTEEGRLRRAGAHTVDRDAVAGDLARERLLKAITPSLVAE